MTAYRFVTLTCDGCGEVYDPGQSITVTDARAAAAVEGWRHRRGPGKDTGPGPGKHRDYCGICLGTHYRTAYGYERYPHE